MGALALHLYRAARDGVRRRRIRSLPTAHGFRLAGNASMQGPGFEPELVALVRALLPQVDMVVDVGANVGFYSCLARAAGRHVLAVEPLPDNLALLYRNLADNGWDDLEVFPLGLSDRPGLATIYGGGTGASLLPGWDGLSERYQRRTVPLSTLDLLVGPRAGERRLLIKMDVEGHEYRALLGAAGVLAADVPPIWIVEISFGEHFPDGRNPHFRETFELFWSHGYVARGADAAGRPVTPADVDRWLAAGRCDGPGNYIFRREAGQRERVAPEARSGQAHG